MCRDWKQEGCNHHFPELNKKKNEIVKFTADKLTELIKHYSKFI